VDASAISLIRDAVCKGRIHTDTNYMDVISGNYRHESPGLTREMKRNFEHLVQEI